MFLLHSEEAVDIDCCMPEPDSPDLEKQQQVREPLPEWELPRQWGGNILLSIAPGSKVFVALRAGYFHTPVGFIYTQLCIAKGAGS